MPGWGGSGPTTVFIHIRHSLHYTYGRPVFLEPMTLRLTPRQDSTQRLLLHTLKVTDEATGASRVVDADGTNAAVLWFDEPRQRLSLQLETVVETLRENPFDWIVTEPCAQRLPLRYDPALTAALSPSLASTPTPSPVKTWADGLAQEVEGSTTAFLMELAHGMHHGFHHVGRPDGDPQPAAETLATRTGACRDTAMLYVEACRSQGLAARFVSGYSIHHPPEVSEHELHAWAEVYVPGGGWRAYDPSLGLAVADGHVPLAAAPDHRLAAAVSGSYRGTGVDSAMTYAIQVRSAPTQEDLDTWPSPALRR